MKIWMIQSWDGNEVLKTHLLKDCPLEKAIDWAVDKCYNEEPLAGWVKGEKEEFGDFDIRKECLISTEDGMTGIYKFNLIPDITIESVLINETPDK